MALPNGGFESGSYWDGWSGNVGYEKVPPELNVVTSPVHSGSYALKCGPLLTAGDFRAFVVYAFPTPPSDVSADVWVYVVSLPAINGGIDILRMSDAEAKGQVNAILGMGADGNTYWGLSRPNGNTTDPYVGILEAVPAVIQVGQWYHVKIRRAVGNGNAVASLYVNDMNTPILTNTAETILSPAYDVVTGMVYSWEGSGEVVIDDADFVVGGVGIGVTINVASAGNGSITASKNPPYIIGESVTFTPVPAGGYRFDHWMFAPNPDVYGQNPLVLPIFQSYDGATLTAYFVQSYIPPPPPDWLLVVAIGATAFVSTVLVVKVARGGKKKRKRRR